MANDKITYIDLFAGVGGLSLGFEREGFENVFSIDFDKSSCQTYKRNFPDNTLIEKDIKDLTKEEILELSKGKEVDIIIGGTPCQGFSMAGNIGRSFLDDPRNHLFKEFARVVSIIKPKFFIIENVARVYNHNKGKTRKEIISLFSKLGYETECKILNAADYGVPQIRNRVFFIGNRIHLPNKFPEKTFDKNAQATISNKKMKKWKTIKEAIDDLPKLNSGETSNIPNHGAMNHSESMLNKMSYVSNGGCRYEIPEELRPKSGDVRKYIKYNADEPSICVTGDMRKVFHYSQNRALSVRELARIQSFPDSFVFVGSKMSQQQQVGNAVPPLLAQAIAKTIKLELGRASNKYPKVNFIGNKEKITDWIFENIPDDVNTIFDAFSGGCSVSFAAKKRGYGVICNDILKVNSLIGKALIENSNVTLSEEDTDLIFSGEPIKGFVYENYSNVYFFPDECMELDQYRNNIEKLDSIYKKALALVLLRRAMVRKMPYSRFNIPFEKVKQLRDEEYSYSHYGRKRAYHNKSFKEHFLENVEEYNNAIFDNGQDNKSYNEDVFNIIPKVNADLIYLDPPYTGTMNNYFGFYGFLDNYINSSVGKPFENNFIDKKISLKLFERLFSQLKNYKYWLLSYNNSSYPDKEALTNLIKKFTSDVQIIEKKHNYQITGKETKTKNKEYLFIVKNKT